MTPKTVTALVEKLTYLIDDLAADLGDERRPAELRAAGCSS